MTVERLNEGPPEPRSGLAGLWDRLVGPGVTPAEWRLELGGTLFLLAGIGLALFRGREGLGWSPVQWSVALLLALDLSGGVVVNATGTAKRWYHRPGQGLWQHMAFVAVHALHLFLVAWLFRGVDWAYFLLNYAYLLLASWLVLRAPLHLQRPTAMTLYAASLLGSFYLLPATLGMAWFLPFFYLKLLVSHLPQETPFRPGEG